MVTEKYSVAIIGCGNIAGPYARDLVAYPEIDLVGVTDVDLQKARDLAALHGCRVYPSVEALLADDAVDLVVNLTIHYAHQALSTQCLAAGKHVYSEKPLALTYREALKLVEFAEERGLRLGCSPFTTMGEAQQTAWKLIREDRLGTVRVAFAEVNWGRIEVWHPNPGPFYEVGVLFDVGVYPLTMLTAIFGPARRVQAYGTVLYPDRETSEGGAFHIETPDFVLAVIELQNGPVVRLTTDFYVSRFSSKQDGLEFHGDDGSIYLSTWHEFDASVELAAFNEPFAPVPLVKEPYPGIEWGRGVRDMVETIVKGEPHRATGEHAAHIVEIIEAINRSFETNRPVEVHSNFVPPAPMAWAG